MKTLKAAKEKTAAAVFATLALCTVFYLVSVCQAGPSFWADPRDKKIIEIGWDALPAAQLLNELPNRQNTSFDGMAFLVPLAGDVDSSICVFDTVQHSPDAYGFDVLQNISKSWGRYTDNLIWVFANHSKSNRDFDWFDDSQWDRIEANAKNLSKCIKISGAKGIALDPEFYYGVNPWQYSADKFSGKTFDQVSQTVRVRGRQYMRGLQSVKSDVVLYGLELIFGSSRNPNPQDNELALLLPFALGMLDEANPGTVLMDASQVNYHLASTAGASYYYDQIRNVVRSNCIPSDLLDKFDRQYLAAYGLCMDLCYVQGSLAVHTNLSADQQDDFWRNNLYYALRNTDRYVSVYTQFKNTVDQRLNWYTGDFIPANAKAIMSEVRTKINANKSLGFSLNTPEVKIMAPSVSWTAGSNQVAAQASAVFSYQNAPGVSHSDLYLDGLYAGTFNGGTVSINASLMSPGKHQLFLRSFSNGVAETFSDSDILLVDATITKSPAIANTAYASSIAGSGSNAYGLPITYEKLSGPSWLSVASDGTLSGTPQTSDSGANLWIVRARNGYGGSDISSLSVMVYPTNNYGTLTGNSTSSGYINRVQLSNLDNTSGNNNGYADFRGLIANLVPGQSVNYTLTPGGNSISTTMAWTIWIDFNRDGSFSDAEKIVTTSASSIATSGSFTVPATATAGPSRMRIAMKRSSTAQTSPTGTFSSGEVEDFSVQIGAGTVPNAVPYFLSAPTTKTDLPAGSPITGSLASNAADWEIDGLTFSKTSGPAWLAIAPDGTLSGIPPASARGLNSFVVGIADSAGGTNAGTLQVNVINNAPLPVSQNVNTAWRKPVSINLTGTDADGDALTFAIDSQPGSGVLSGTAPALTYTPGELFSGTDSFTFHVSDGFVNGLIENYNFDLPASPGYYGAEAPDPVDQGGIGWTFDTAGGNAGVANAGSYWVPPGGTSPTGGNFAYIAYGGGAFQNISPGEGLITVSFYAVGFTGNPASTNIDISVGGTALKFSGSSVSIGNTAWTFYTSDPVNVGAGSQNLIFGRINNVGSGNAEGGVFIDGVSIMRHGTVNIAVGRQNSTPVPISQNVSTAWRTPILINLTGTDADGDTLAFAVDSLPAGGLLSGTAPALTYTPGATFSGTDSFTFHVSDGFVNGLIENYNFDLPASPGYYGAEAPGIVDQGGGWTFDNTGGSAGVAAPASYWAPPGGSSPDGGNFAYIAYGGGVFQNISPGEGLITVSFYAVGSTGNPASTNIDISVGGTALKFSGSSVSIGNTAWKLYTSDPINVGAGNQNLLFGRINNVGGGNAQGGVFIDGVTIMRHGTVNIAVGHQNSAPVPISQNVSTAWRTPILINLTGTDADGDTLAFAVNSLPAGGLLSGTAPALTYTPGATFSGTDSFTFHVSDGFEYGLIANYNFELPALPGYYGAEAPGIVDQGGGWTFDNTGGSAGVAAPASYWAPPGGSSPDGGNFAYIAYGGGVFQNISPGEGLITVSFYAVGSTGNPASTNIDISVGGTALKFSGSSVSIGNTAWKLYTSDPINVGAGNQNLLFGRINNVGSGNAQGGVFIDGVTITRYGTVTIVVGPAPYDAWKQTNFTTQQLAQSSVSGDLSDPDHDGVPNLIEYGLGTDPNKTLMIGLPTLSTTGDYLSLTFTRQKWAADITYRIEAAGDLTSSWTEIWSSSSVPYGGGNNASESVTVQDSVSVYSASTHRRFMRLKITKP